MGREGWGREGWGWEGRAGCSGGEGHRLEPNSRGNAARCRLAARASDNGGPGTGGYGGGGACRAHTLRSHVHRGVHFMCTSYCAAIGFVLTASFQSTGSLPTTAASRRGARRVSRPSRCRRRRWSGGAAAPRGCLARRTLLGGAQVMGCAPGKTKPTSASMDCLPCMSSASRT